MDAVTRSTTVLGPADLQYPQLRRHPVEHFAHRVFDKVQGTAAARAGRLIDAKHYFFARQMRGQRLSMRESFNDRFNRCGLLCTRKGSAQIGVQVLKSEGELIGTQLLRSCAELSALEFADDEAKTFNFIVSLRQAARHIAHQLVQEGLIGGQILKINPHGRSYFFAVQRARKGAVISQYFKSFSRREFRLPGALWISPVDALDEHRELRRA
jgi:hypothetical protein